MKKERGDEKATLHLYNLQVQFPLIQVNISFMNAATLLHVSISSVSPIAKDAISKCNGV